LTLEKGVIGSSEQVFNNWEAGMVRVDLSRRALLAGAASGVLLAAGGARAQGALLNVVATTAHVGDLVRNVGGDRVRVANLLGEGVDPHSYRLTRSDTAQLMRADVVAYNGLLLEGKMTDALVRVASAGKTVFAVADALPEGLLIAPPETEGSFDPHVWMDVKNWIAAAGVVRDRLSARDPAGAAAYAANAARHVAELEVLDAYARRVLGAVPETARVLITAHDAFNYLGRAYGLEVRGIQGISTESEAGLREIEGLVDLLVARRIGAVFVESSVTDRNVRALVEGAAARGHKVAIGGELYSDALGAPGTYEGTYIGMMDHNLTTIARALGGEAPVAGHLGRLAQAR
jgi:manganese/zinc/iron transport system substrate-binding protein